ncbi:CRAL-TRIO domain-containing protein [Stachybotrys elegans]|uniref:CRAL-TRIO domain-containing protein n=1 Tax=Stachybotrys elegans TaxID=80388 RepID=A0A8K0WT72_9HYPO|nr:CRAL-TRIO domain-containing protein [Stachybotrys elegans]
MANEVQPGRPGNLTPEQEEKVRQLWQSILQLCGVYEDAVSSSAASATKTGPEPETPKKKRFGVFRRKGSDKPSPAESPAKGTDEDDKYGQTKQFQETLANQSPESIRATIWQMVKHDHPDALVLRFLRARKWDIYDALVMFVATMNWRLNDMKVDDDIMKAGEGGATEAAQNSSDPAVKTLNEDFLEQARMGKSYLHGTDKNGRPICVVRVKLHKQGEQCEESLERYTVFIIETARMVLAPPVDTATIIFDMTGFSMANMDYGPVKFMIKCFEANYPESLGAVLVHNAPWVFQGIWKIIKGWLDPVVAGKVHFTNNRSGLEDFIEPSHIIKELGGDEDWEFKYIEPIPGENDTMKDTATRDALIKAREDLVKEYEATTIQWINEPQGDNAKAIKAKRDTIAKQLRDNYWQLDPYVRARSLYDRQGVIQEGGKIDWYHPKPPQPPAPAAQASAGPETSADDVD